jgi:signal recognition particle GTPase
MINLTNKVQVIKEGKDLSAAVTKAIQDAKQCVVDHFLGEQSGRSPTPSATPGLMNA